MTAPFRGEKNDEAAVSDHDVWRCIDSVRRLRKSGAAFCNRENMGNISAMTTTERSSVPGMFDALS
jgi:hypothetical protein